MSRTHHTSSTDHAGEQVEIDRSDFIDRTRYTCPNGHTTWDPTNSHIWCRGCRRLADAGHDGIDPEHYAVHDKKADEPISWDRVSLVE